MTNRSMRARSARKLLAAFALAAPVAASVGCGSSSQSPDPQPAVEGVATPESVAVVTATNAE